MARMMEQLQDAADGGEVQRNLLQKTGESITHQFRRVASVRGRKVGPFYCVKQILIFLFIAINLLDLQYGLLISKP